MVYKTGLLLGQISKTSGFDGTVLVRLEKRFIDKIPELESVFLDIDGKPVPFFIESSEYTGAEILKLKFSGYDSAFRAEEFKGSRVFLTFDIADDDHIDDLTIIEGFLVKDHDRNDVGIITGTIENPGQTLLILKTAAAEEILVPFHEDLILAIDLKKRIIKMDIPEGLTAINS